MQKITFQNYPNTTTPINATNLNQLQTNVESAINPVKTTDANGWTVLTYNNHKEYLKKGSINYTLNGNTWARFEFANLPSNMSSLGNNILTASVNPNDGAICCSIGALTNSTKPIMQLYNAYGQQISATIYYQLHIIEIPNN